MQESRKVIGVFGSSRRAEGSVLYREAYDLGRALARAGHAVLTGGYGGSMGAVSRGAAEEGGWVIGVTCALFDPLAPNQWVCEEAKLPDLVARLTHMIERSDAFIALRGGIGTLSEVTLVWSLLQTRSLVDKPLLLLGADWPPLLEALRAHTDLGGSVAALAHPVATPDEALTVLAKWPRTGPVIPPAQG